MRELGYETFFGEPIELAELEGRGYTELFNQYATSPYGQYHATQVPRFSGKFAYEPAQMLVDLGDDVHPVLHGLHTRVEVFEPLAYFQNVVAEDAEKFTAREVAVGRIATQFHDIGECTHPMLSKASLTVVGDIARLPGTEKNKAAEAAEGQIFEYLLDKTVPILRTAGLVPEITAVIQDKDSSLTATAFNDGEPLGYYMTGIRAAYLAMLETRHRKANTATRDNLSYEQLMSFGRKVPVGWYDAIRSAEQRFPFMKFKLDQTLPLLEQAHREHGWKFSLSTIV